MMIELDGTTDQFEGIHRVLGKIDRRKAIAGSMVDARTGIG